jgi:hypothetical protein
VHIRVRSTINGITSEPIFSSAIDRAATTFQSSECGSFCTIGIIGDATQVDGTKTPTCGLPMRPKWTKKPGQPQFTW